MEVMKVDVEMMGIMTMLLAHHGGFIWPQLQVDRFNLEQPGTVWPAPDSQQLELSFALGSRSVHDLFLRIHVRHVHLQEAARVVMEVVSSLEGFSLDFTKQKHLQQDRYELNFGPPTPELGNHQSITNMSIVYERLHLSKHNQSHSLTE
jgi:hypothetical protein